MVSFRLPPTNDRTFAYYGDDLYWGSGTNVTWTQYTTGTPSLLIPTTPYGGLVQVQINASANAYVTIAIGPLTTSGGCIANAAGYDITWRAKFGDLTLSEHMVGATAIGSIVSDRVAMGYKQDVSANWILESAGATMSRTITDIPADTNWHDFRMICEGGAINYYIDGLFLGTISSNLTALYMAPFVYVQTYEAVLKYLTIDYMSVFSGRQT